MEYNAKDTMHRIFYKIELNAHNVLHLNSYRSWAQSSIFILRVNPYFAIMKQTADLPFT